MTHILFSDPDEAGHADGAAELDRPALPEVAIGLVVAATSSLIGGLLLVGGEPRPLASALLFTAVSGGAAALALLATWLVRRRSWQDFGIRAAPGRWNVVAAGLAAALLSVEATVTSAYTQLMGEGFAPLPPAEALADAGPGTLFAAIILIGLITPVAQELFYRGVVTNAFLRHGRFVPVMGGALISAAFHDPWLVFPMAFLTGLCAGEMFRRSASIWPALIVHTGVTLPSILLVAAFN